MAGVKDKCKQRAITVFPKTLTFGLFTGEEIQQLSVVKISNPNSFDAIGHPVSGGLYDLSLGPVDRFSTCSTCFNNVVNCPGHLGQIDLPLPVINPLFHDVVAKIIKISCLKCHTIFLPFENKYILINQLRLLDLGNIKEALEFEAYFNKQEDKPARFTQEVYNSLIAKSNENYTEKINGKLGEILSEVVATGNIQNIRDEFISETLRLGAKCTVCPNCNGRIQKIKVLQKKIIINVKLEVAEKFKDNKVDGKSLQLSGGQRFIMPSETLEHLRKIWLNEKSFLNEVIPVLKTTLADYATDLFFFTVVVVTPSNVRPANFVDGILTEHVQNKVYKAILDDCFVIKSVIHLMKDKDNAATLSEERKVVVKQLPGQTLPEKLQFSWQSLQSHCDLLLVEDKSSRFSIDSIVGLKQILEKKEGIIRMHMMGKRVNFAARTVITPDPNLNIDEIGIPEEFAKKLTYPVPVTPWNVKLLRKMVINGPDVHPGASVVEMEDGNRIRILANNSTQRESIANQLLTPGGVRREKDKTQGIKVLHRHLINGDVLLMNRQPTLHKPSIMAHRARILKGERTIRLHYSNCKSYNADFDGDEMNAHFPQNELARSEAYNIVSVCNQYLVPKDGTPLGGLIQDHMVSGVRLSVRGKFFSRQDYMQLVFQALPYVHGDIKTLPPCILKPVQLWSGKQIISTVILNIIPKGKAPVNLESTAKINAKAWVKGETRTWKAGGTPFKNPNTMTEAEVIIRNGELLCGVLDKTHYGATPYSLVHCLYELYGGECASKLLSSFGKLFAAFLQIEGFTLGVKDILVTKEADSERLEHIAAVRKIGYQAATSALDLPKDTDESELKIRLEDAHKKNPKFRQIVDRHYKNLLDSYTNKINSACIPNGLIERFPHNNLQLMVQSGAKGSTVNTMQISCLLGQIELEGKRPPLMVSGRSLPSFPPYETSARAGGFVDGRFMTGIKPQEFFFHCMAGREGLVDTAVKTSRSGYLQRCLIKHLEGLTVNYDMTVRDSDGSVIQFQYGEDGMDVSKAQFFKKDQVQFLVENSKAIVNNDVLNKLKNDNDKSDVIKKHHKKFKSWNKHHTDLDNMLLNKQAPFFLFCSEMEEKVSKFSPFKLRRGTGRSAKAAKLCKMWNELSSEQKSVYYKKCKQRPDPISCQLQPDRDFGVICEKLDSLINDYFSDRNGFISSSVKKEVRDMICLKSMTSMCSPGEPVGILAAQSVGEPSTQMTLNTFHFAGRGEMNVTLGIPRLREVLMMAAKNIKTPSIEVPFRKNMHGLNKKADRLRKKMTRITLEEVLEYVTVTERQDLGDKKRRQLYDIYFRLLPKEAYGNNTNLKPHHIIKLIEKNLPKLLSKPTYSGKDAFIIAETKKTKRSKRNEESDDREDDIDFVEDEAKEDTKGRHKNAESESSEEEEEALDDDDATTTKLRARRMEEQEYQEKEDDDNDGDEDKKNEFIEDFDVENDDNSEVDEEEQKERTMNVIESSEHIENYRYDAEKHMWCEVTLSYPHYTGRIDFCSLLKERASSCVLSEVSGIRRAFTYTTDDKLMFKTDGLNFSEMFKYDDLLNLNKLYSNDIHGIAETYGIEAAAKVIVKEVQDVFKVYGITVDPRHLLLIADYMTFDGTIKPLNRKGIEGSLSPLQQMSFESSTRFLKLAVMRGKTDSLNSPSSRLILGQPCKSGTGIVDVRLSSSIFLSK